MTHGRPRSPAGTTVFRAGLPLGQRCFQGSVVSKAGLFPRQGCFQGLDVIETADASHISAGPSRPAAPDSPAGAGRGGNPQRHRWNIGAGLTWPDDTDVPSVLPGPRRRPGSQVHRGLIGSRRTAWMLAKLERPALRGMRATAPERPGPPHRARGPQAPPPEPRCRCARADPGRALVIVDRYCPRAGSNDPQSCINGVVPRVDRSPHQFTNAGQGCFEASAALRAGFACGQRAATAQSKRRGPG